MAHFHELGRRGEALAADMLVRDGWSIAARNYRLGHKEIDIVARRGTLVAFVEVKTRRGPGFGHPLESITARKRRELARVALSWIARHGRPGDTYRYDAVAIHWRRGGHARLEHVEDAWRT